MSSLQMLQQLEELRDLILERATAAIDRGFALGGVTINVAEKMEVEYETGKYVAYKLAGTKLDAIIEALKKAQAEEAAA
jgi:hypothetical protein